MASTLRGSARLFAVVPTVAVLAACAYFFVLSYKSTPRAHYALLTDPIRQAAPRGDKEIIAARKGDKEQAATPTFVVMVKPEIYSGKNLITLAPDKEAKQRDATYGIASFYWSGSRTANGEKFDPRNMTAAHRNLPFGTRVRVTDVSTGRSVMVRINDRGPYIPGRIVDVSKGAAEQLGIVDRGLAKVKLDVVTN
jgi:rare lipoprotein A